MIVGSEALSSVRAAHAAESIVLVNGTFDIVPTGHVHLLEVAKKIADIVVVGLWDDDNVAYRKGPQRPYNKIADRMRVVDTFKPVDYTFKVPGTGWPEDVMPGPLAALQPDVYLASSRNHILFDGQASIEHENGSATRFVYDLSYGQKAHSTTEILSKLRANS